MLSVTGLNHFYYVRDFTDMRCKHSRVLSIIRETASPGTQRWGCLYSHVSQSQNSPYVFI